MVGDATRLAGAASYLEGVSCHIWKSYGYWIACTSVHYQLQKLRNWIRWEKEAWKT